MYRISKSSICHIIGDVCHTILKVLPGEIKLLKNENEWLNIADGFQRKWNFPHCIGAIDGKHIRITAPANSGSTFFNYKEFFSIVLIAVADADYKFIYANAGVQGRISDGSVLKYTSLYAKFLKRTLGLPQSATLPGRREPVPYMFIALMLFQCKSISLNLFLGIIPSICGNVFLTTAYVELVVFLKTHLVF